MRTPLLAILCLTLVSTARAQITLAPVFTTNMVLQRGMDVPIWGTAANGETVTVKMRGQTVVTKAAGGRWMLKLKSMTAGGPFLLTAQGATKMVTILNVMVGDVWLCSGQSNMVLRLNLTTNGAAAIQTAGNQKLRLFTSPGGGGWKVSNSTSAATFSAVAFYFGRELANKLGVTVGLMQAAVGGTRVSSWRRGGTWYNGRIKPLIPYGLRGAIWYQGEADSRAALSVDYESRFQAMIREWRADWGQGEFPFLFVQLPRYTRNSPYWMYIREAQLGSLGSSNTGMACTIDIVSGGGIHPPLKLPVGQRLALAARRIAHGQNVVHSGPIFDPRTSAVVGNRFVAGFQHVGSGLVAVGGALRGFEIAGSNLTYIPAAARIVGAKVEVSATGVTKPVAIRYGWALSPNVNLFNKEGLPASPFRSDAEYWTLGTACGQSPRPSLRATLQPRLARPFELRIENMTASKPGMLFTGVSSSVWGTLTLPVDLSVMGMSGCRLYTSGEVQSGFVANSSGARDLRFNVPNSSTLLGSVFFNQALVTMPGSNPLGVAATNAGRGKIGPR